MSPTLEAIGSLERSIAQTRAEIAEIQIRLSRLLSEAELLGSQVHRLANFIQSTEHSVAVLRRETRP
jgi:hypothetical protein